MSGVERGRAASFLGDIPHQTEGIETTEAGMANNSTTGTGVLKLKAVTPVIKALFGVFSLEEIPLGDGAAYIRMSTDEGLQTWADVKKALGELAVQEQVIVHGEKASLSELVNWLARHYGKDASSVTDMLESIPWEPTTLAEMFDLAQVLDDGHGLHAIELEGANTCSRPMVGDVGGFGIFITERVVMKVTSQDALSVGERLDTAVQRSDVVQAARVLQTQVRVLLTAISDEAFRAKVANELRIALELEAGR